MLCITFLQLPSADGSVGAVHACRILGMIVSGKIAKGSEKYIQKKKPRMWEKVHEIFRLSLKKWLYPGDNNSIAEVIGMAKEKKNQN